MISIKKLMGYRGWKVWMSYDMHISLLALFYVLVVDNLFRPLDSLVLISSLGFYFMFGFLINDFFDMPYDLAAGKRRTIQELPKTKFIGIISVIIFISALHIMYLQKIQFIIIYIITYILATLYSAPPIRFKSRGFSGIVVNGFIEKMLPVLAVFAFFGHFGMDTFIFLAASFSIGVVEIITHQIYDHESDLRTGVHTFVVGVGIDKTVKIFRGFISPFSSAIIVLLLFVISKIPYTNFIAVSVSSIYVVVSLLISKGLLSRGEKVFPLYMSCLFLLILNAFPVFFALVLTFKSVLNMPLLLIVLCSQYYILKYRIISIKERVIPHTNIFVDTWK